MKKTTVSLITCRNGIRCWAVAAALSFGVASSSLGAVNITLSGTDLAGNQPIINFLNSNFQGVNVTFGDYSNPANIPAGTDVFIVGRILGSFAYANAANSQIFNNLTIPVVSFTSFVTRPDGDRWAWHSTGTVGGDVSGSETTITGAGASLFGGEGTADWFTIGTSGTGFNALGSGTVGTGSILATIGGNILVAAWESGQQSAGGVTFSANRLLFNLPDSQPNPPALAVLPDTIAGQQALISALTTYTPLQVPEPSSFALLGLGALAAIRGRRCRIS
jgi:hypothetical protein